jgi:3-isopropylmalate/(R)-2-methylmalate dehydratase small subunit
MKLSGKVWKFGDNVGATDIVSAQYDSIGMNRRWEECAKHLFEESDPSIAGAIQRGDIIVAGASFGAGHAHYYSTAIMACKTAGIRGFLVESISGLFQRACIDFGLAAWALPGIADFVSQGDQLEIDLATGEAKNHTTGATTQFKPVSRTILDIVEADGSKNWALKRVGAEHAIA